MEAIGTCSPGAFGCTKPAHCYAQHCCGTPWGHEAWRQPPPPVVTETLATQESLGGGLAATRPPWGGAPSAGAPARPCPELLGNGKGRRGGDLTSPAWHRSCRLGGHVQLCTWGGQRAHVALARRLSPPGDILAAEIHPGPSRATRAVAAGRHRSLCTMWVRGTPWHPAAAIAASPGRRHKPRFAPSPAAIPVSHTGQDPSRSPGGPARTRATCSQTAASHPPPPGGVFSRTFPPRTRHSQQQPLSIPGGGTGGVTCR